MMILNFFRERISTQNKLLLAYHRAVGFFAAVCHFFPARNLKVIGVTGTKGKTTTCHMIAKIFEEAGYRVGLATSVAFKIGDKEWPNETKKTTLGRFQTQKLLARMRAEASADGGRKEKCDVVVLEISSHALAQSRVFGIPIHTAVLTNLLGDHLEYHGSFEEYRKAKMKLFSKHPKVSILPVEEPNFPHFDKLSSHQKITYGLQDGMMHGHEMQLEREQTSLKLHLETPTKDEQQDVTIHLPGEANVRNALAAAATASAWNIPLKTIVEGLEKMRGMPGRYESVDAGQPFSVIVDYAHTPESLESICSFYRRLTTGKLILVFGATGGGRDKAKRPHMGEVADRYADIIILTDDDPYTEDRHAIVEMIAQGISPDRLASTLFKIIDRRTAIKKALSLAEKHDTVILAGKGCESVIMIGEKRIPWDDRQIVREILTT